MRIPVIAGNWKMNGTQAETEELIQGLLAEQIDFDLVEVVISPPFTSLETASRELKGSKIALSGQNMSDQVSGAYTGDVSAEMLLTVGATFCILGHSERRQYYAESDQLINAKSRRALDSGLTPIICVGETLEQREQDRTEAVIGEQIAGVLSGFGADELAKVVIAYEPVWAIGTGKTATPEMAQNVHKFIRGRLAAIDEATAQRVRILYGGSVKPDNAADLLACPDIDGALVGGASLKAGDFVSIINAV